ncbi:MAG: dipeptidyl aminopeptidase [Cytophagaceae bacterium SCN 52-12]|nr:MAG: dipeptidyl aminopeptidase [Cytophagaceae bacterium SCN 52-12]
MRAFFNILLFCLFLGCAPASAQSPGLLEYRTPGGAVKSIKKASEWPLKKKQILEGLQEATGPLPDLKNLPVPAVTFIDTLHGRLFDRYTVHVQSYPGEIVPALLYVPNHLPKGSRVPAVIALHGTGAKGKFLTDSSEAGPNRATATELAYRGYVVLAPDYPSFGALTDHDFSKDRFESGVMQAVFNNMRCIDYLQSRPDVDAGKIGAIGHSLGGHTAIFLGAFDQRVKIVVSSCGWTPFEYYNAGKSVTERYGGKLGPWAQDRYMPLVRDRFGLDPARMPFNFDEVIAAIAPRYFFSNSPVNDSNFNVEGIRKGEASARRVYRLLKADDHMEVHYPDAGHDFPPEVRELAYKKIDEVLKNTYLSR